MDPNAPTRAIPSREPGTGRPAGGSTAPAEGQRPAEPTAPPPSDAITAPRISGLGSGLLARQPAPKPGEGVTVRKICPHCGTEYETDARFCPKDGAALRPTGGSDPLIGHTLGDRYHILSLVGEGGMGRIYLAEHVRIGRQCAVKIMRANLVDDADAAARFAREASSAARIIHPNVAAVFDYGESEGNVYLVMEFVEGESLGAILQRERVLAPPRALEIARQVADALGAAHELGIVHRDLKPDNILITRTKGGKEVAKVVDFGIAKAVEEGPGQKLTETGLVIGTPEFMSPEQLIGDPVDARSDVYSLGCILYLMLVGVPAADAPTREAMLKRRLNEGAPHPKAAVDTLPPEVDAVVATALAPSPGDRYQTAADLRDALTRIAAALAPVDAVPAHLPAAAAAGTSLSQERPAMTPATAWYTPRRGLGVAGVLMLAMLAIFLMQSDRGPRPAPDAVGQTADSIGGLAQPRIGAAPGSDPADTLPAAGAGGLTTGPATVPPMRTPAESARADSARRAGEAERALRSALQPSVRRFADAIAARDLDALRAASPGLTEPQARQWQTNFSTYPQIGTRVDYGRPALSPDGGALQPFRLTMRLSDAGGSSTTTGADYIARFERSGNAWVLRSISPP